MFTPKIIMFTPVYPKEFIVFIHYCPVNPKSVIRDIIAFISNDRH